LEGVEGVTPGGLQGGGGVGELSHNHEARGKERKTNSKGKTKKARTPI